jgi:hypothetical protein
LKDIKVLFLFKIFSLFKQQVYGPDDLPIIKSQNVDKKLMSSKSGFVSVISQVKIILSLTKSTF